MPAVIHKPGTIAKRKKAHYPPKHSKGKLQYGAGASAASDKQARKAGLLTRIDKLKVEIAQIENEGSQRPIKNEANEGGAGFDSHEAGIRIATAMQKAEGGAWTGGELAERFYLMPATLHKRRKEHRIVFWRDAKHEFHYPKWQFTEAGALRAGVQEVLQMFRSPDEWRVMRYFLAPRHQLGDRTPLDLLRAGEVDKVIAHAKAHGEENSW